MERKTEHTHFGALRENLVRRGPPTVVWTHWEALRIAAIACHTQTSREDAGGTLKWATFPRLKLVSLSPQRCNLIFSRTAPISPITRAELRTERPWRGSPTETQDCREERWNGRSPPILAGGPAHHPESGPPTKHYCSLFQFYSIKPIPFLFHSITFRVGKNDPIHSIPFHSFPFLHAKH